MNYAEMGLMRAPRQGLLEGYFEEIRRASGRAANLTRQLLAFSRRRAIAPEVVDLNRIILDVERMLRHVIRENIELVTLLNPGLRMIKVDPNQMEQVLLNLVVNASDAMPGGGKLVIATCNTYVPEELAHNRPQLSVGPSVCLSVSDSGVGMTKEVEARIFEPFFTTKDDAKGTGLGLASCHAIIAQSGGLTTVDSEPGRGTTFNIYLPAVDQTAASPRSGEHPETTPIGTETILLRRMTPSFEVSQEACCAISGIASWRRKTEWMRWTTRACEGRRDNVPPGRSSAEVWRLKTVPPVAFNQERQNLIEGGLDVQGGDVPASSQGLLCRRDERSRGCAGIRTAPGHGAQDAQVLGTSRVSTRPTA